MSTQLLPPASSAISCWELAGFSLSDALEKYLALSENLGNKALLENIPPLQLTARIDSALQSLHTNLSRKFNLTHSTLARTRNCFASRSYCLPREILTEIFLDVVYSSIDQLHPASMETTLLQMFRSLSSLQQVCRVWREIIVTRGTFWHFAPVYCTVTPDLRCTQAPNLALERSNGNLYLAAVMKLNIPGLLRTLPISPRIRKANIVAESYFAIQDFIKAILDSNPPATMSELSLYVERDHNGPSHNFVRILSGNSHEWGSFCEFLNSLSVLRVRGAHFDWTNMTFSHRLVEICIQDVMMGSDTGDFVQFLRNLSLAPNLRDLKLVSVSSSFDRMFLRIASAEKKIQFPSLESLLLADLPCNTLITAVFYIAPGSHTRTLYLTERCIQPVDHPYETIDFEVLFDNLEVEQVDTLALSGECIHDWLPISDLPTILCSVPELKSLKLSGWTLGERECSAIANTKVEGSGSDARKFPELAYLDLSRARIRDEEWLKQVVISHPIQRMVLGGSILKDNGGTPKFEPLQSNDPIVEWLGLNVPDFTLVDDEAQPAEFSCFVWQLW
ncbi:unnamed protein product [Rhizoctonia solani]|uniref:F-box domain-containing protein n=1 Tax=Rhizoctonia solani TaxID=456999 RepID=A0A8H2XWQ9_9AGAM|nr:unnamed protein product [Rhizoctonia solani]